MIPRLPGWSSARVLDGIAFTHPDGADTASVLYRERVTPLKRVAACVEAILAGWPQLEVTAVSGIERFLTAEHEHAALVTVQGRDAGRPVQRALGFVLTDEFYAATTVSSFIPDYFEAARDLAIHLVTADGLRLGTRPRRFEYTPPPGFQPRRHALSTEWIGPGDTSIWVHPAVPSTELPEELMTDAALEICDELPAGLTGVVSVIRSTEELRHLVVLHDGIYAYPFELVVRGGDQVSDHFAALVRSTRVVPRGAASGIVPELG